jgi:hypothetical protein
MSKPTDSAPKKTVGISAVGIYVIVTATIFGKCRRRFPARNQPSAFFGRRPRRCSRQSECFARMLRTIWGENLFALAQTASSRDVGTRRVGVIRSLYIFSIAAMLAEAWCWRPGAGVSTAGGARPGAVEGCGNNGMALGTGGGAARLRRRSALRIRRKYGAAACAT